MFSLNLSWRSVLILNMVIIIWKRAGEATVGSVQGDFIAALRSSWLLNLSDMLALLRAVEVENVWLQG
jgi:hypothetical protein